MTVHMIPAVVDLEMRPRRILLRSKAAIQEDQSSSSSTGAQSQQML